MKERVKAEGREGERAGGKAYNIDWARKAARRRASSRTVHTSAAGTATTSHASRPRWNLGESEVGRVEASERAPDGEAVTLAASNGARLWWESGRESRETTSCRKAGARLQERGGGREGLS